MARIAINGFGRVGRAVVSVGTERGEGGREIVSIDDVTETKALAHPLKRGSVRVLDAKVKVTYRAIVVDGGEIQGGAREDSAGLPATREKNRRVKEDADGVRARIAKGLRYLLQLLVLLAILRATACVEEQLHPNGGRAGTTFVTAAGPLPPRA